MFWELGVGSWELTPQVNRQATLRVEPTSRQSRDRAAPVPDSNPRGRAARALARRRAWSAVRARGTRCSGPSRTGGVRSRTARTRCGVRKRRRRDVVVRIPRPAACCGPRLRFAARAAGAGARSAFPRCACVQGSRGAVLLPSGNSICTWTDAVGYRPLTRLLSESPRLPTRNGGTVPPVVGGGTGTDVRPARSESSLSRARTAASDPPPIGLSTTSVVPARPDSV